MQETKPRQNSLYSVQLFSVCPNFPSQIHTYLNLAVLHHLPHTPIRVTPHEQATRLFVQNLIQAKKLDRIKALHYRTLCAHHIPKRASVSDSWYHDNPVNITFLPLYEHSLENTKIQNRLYEWKVWPSPLKPHICHALCHCCVSWCPSIYPVQACNARHNTMKFMVPENVYICNCWLHRNKNILFTM